MRITMNVDVCPEAYPGVYCVVEYEGGVIACFDENDLFHNPNGPAVTWPSGAETWYIHGVLDRNPDDGPAITWPSRKDPRHLTCTIGCEVHNAYDLCREAPGGYEIWVVNGTPVNRPGGLPAEVNHGKSVAWYGQGGEHNWAGPARVFTNGLRDHKGHIEVEWFLEGWYIDDITSTLEETNALTDSLYSAWDEAGIDDARAKVLLSDFEGIPRLWVLRVLLANERANLSDNYRAFLGMMALSIPNMLEPR